jgi:hypothetical protein
VIGEECGYRGQQSMGKKLAYERYYWFHGQIKSGHYPNARKLAERFELSDKQAQRDIEFMRDRLYAPLSFNPAQKGYEYEDDSYQLPPIWFKDLQVECKRKLLPQTFSLRESM